MNEEQHTQENHLVHGLLGLFSQINRQEEKIQLYTLPRFFESNVWFGQTGFAVHFFVYSNLVHVDLLGNLRLMNIASKRVVNQQEIFRAGHHITPRSIFTRPEIENIGDIRALTGHRSHALPAHHARSWLRGVVKNS